MCFGHSSQTLIWISIIFVRNGYNLHQNHMVIGVCYTDEPQWLWFPRCCVSSLPVVIWEICVVCFTKANFKHMISNIKVTFNWNKKTLCQYRRVSILRMILLFTHRIPKTKHQKMTMCNNTHIVFINDDNCYKYGQLISLPAVRITEIKYCR